MRAARIVPFVLFILVSAIPGVAQLLWTSPVGQRSGVPFSVYARRFTLPAKPDTPRFQFQWSRDPTFATKPLPKMRRFTAPFVGVRRGRPITAEEEDNVCYTVRSYRYARASRDSDVTTPVGYTVCTPSAKFQVKSAGPTPR